MLGTYYTESAEIRVGSRPDRARASMIVTVPMCKCIIVISSCRACTVYGTVYQYRTCTLRVQYLLRKATE